jgi:ectoine hydroxylase-related dioxygenase (phytanoyl-CoA dioxygenase family)
MPHAATLSFVRDGAQRFAAAIDGTALLGIAAAVSHGLPERAGIRLQGIPALRPYLAADQPIGAIAASVLGAGAKPVRAILFDKTPRSNWRLGWHQDRAIAVRRRVEVPGYGPWSIKGGLHHVAPPADLLAEMATLRLHLDRVEEDNAPLLVAPGSHRLGRVAESAIAGAVERCGRVACLAEPGDIWLYATPILHASDAAVRPTRRRVLQVDYCARALPEGLDWLGV